MYAQMKNPLDKDGVLKDLEIQDQWLEFVNESSENVQFYTEKATELAKQGHGGSKYTRVDDMRLVRKFLKSKEYTNLIKTQQSENPNTKTLKDVTMYDQIIVTLDLDDILYENLIQWKEAGEWQKIRKAIENRKKNPLKVTNKKPYEPGWLS